MKSQTPKNLGSSSTNKDEDFEMSFHRLVLLSFDFPLPVIGSTVIIVAT